MFKRFGAQLLRLALDQRISRDCHCRRLRGVTLLSASPLRTRWWTPWNQSNSCLWGTLLCLETTRANTVSKLSNDSWMQSRGNRRSTWEKLEIRSPRKHTYLQGICFLGVFRTSGAAASQPSCLIRFHLFREVKRPFPLDCANPAFTI